MKIRYSLAASLALCACSTAPVAEKEPAQAETPAQEQRVPAQAQEPRYVFKGELKKMADAFSDPAILRQSATFGNRYDYMVKNNLHDTGVDAADPAACAEIMRTPHRTADGRCYFQGQKVFAKSPNVGAKSARFGRNSRPLDEKWVANAKENLLVPNPRLVSKELLERKDGKFIPVPSLNLFAAAWLQMENHDWFSHGKNVTPHSGAKMAASRGTSAQKHFEYINIPPVPGDSLFPDGIQVPRTRPDLTETPRKGYALTYRNAVTHWWDASQIYGSDAQTIQQVRTNPQTGRLYEDGLIAVDERNRRLYYTDDGTPITGFHDNWWIGLELLHTLFALEHNHIARTLKAKYPKFSGDELFEKARLINAALMAKIHTVEWTPALLDNKIGHIGMYANWYGLRKSKSEDWRRILAKVSKNFSQTLNGLTGPGTLEPHGVPFTLTEEFVAVYRMHPLLPDFLEYRPLDNPNLLERIPLQETTFEKAGRLVEKNASRDVLYSFLTSHPGALTTNNFPKFLQPITVQRNTEGVPSLSLEMGTIDIVRDRERLVPRYNEFRRQLGLKAIAKFSDLTTDKDVVEKLERIYGGDVEKLDLQVGSLAEADRLQGFAFGNTPFSIFQLMASRRLMADPFYTEYFTPAVYTQEGLDWANKQSFIDVVTRHFPEMKSKLKNVVNGFHPWNE